MVTDHLIDANGAALGYERAMRLYSIDEADFSDVDLIFWMSKEDRQPKCAAVLEGKIYAPGGIDWWTFRRVRGYAVSYVFDCGSRFARLARRAKVAKAAERARGAIDARKCWAYWLELAAFLRNLPAAVEHCFETNHREPALGFLVA